MAVFGRLDHNDWVAEGGIRRARWQVIARDVIILRRSPRGSLSNDKGYTSLTSPLVASARGERCNFTSGRTPYPDGAAA